MQFLRDKIKELRPLFEKGGKYEKFYYVYEGHETLFFQPNHVTPAKGAHIRDAIDLKRLMVTVIIAMIPCLLFGIWNVGYQHYLATGQEGSLLDAVIFGAIKVIPIVAVSYIVGLGIEFTFCSIRKHSINEGFLVSGMLIPLIIPATTPLWQVAIATAFAVIIGKEVFGGTGMNLLNPALTARAFLFFAYPGQLSGDKVWVALDGMTTVDGYSGATALARAAESGLAHLPSFGDMFLGTIAGSIGETSTLMAIIGAVILIATGVGSWKIMVSMVAGGAFMGLIIQTVGGIPFAEVPFYYQLVMGGFAFGTVFMATDPVSAAQTETGKYIYGFLAGLFSILIRVINPAYPEGVMLAILLMNVFAPLIDYVVVSSNKNRRLSRATV